MGTATVKKNIFGKEITPEVEAAAVIEIMEAGKELGRQEAHVKGIIRQIDVDKIGPNPWQPRQTVDSVKVQELADDIAVRGLLQPITVRTMPSKNGTAEFSIENTEFDFQLAWGQRRIKAVQLLLEQSRWEGGIDAQVQDLTDEEMILGSLAENNARESVDIIEETRAIHQALMTIPGLRATDVAKTLGMSKGQLSSRRSLLRLPDTVLEMVTADKMAWTAARELVGLVRKECDHRDVIEEVLQSMIAYTHGGTVTIADIKGMLNYIPRNKGMMRLRPVQSWEEHGIDVAEFKKEHLTHLLAGVLWTCDVAAFEAARKKMCRCPCATCGCHCHDEG